MMKRILTILLISLLGITLVNAQTDESKLHKRPTTTQSSSQKSKQKEQKKKTEKKESGSKGKSKSSSGSSRDTKSNAPTIGTSNYTPNVVTFTANGVSFQMVEVQGGTFRMGATSEQGSDSDNDGKPVHKVTLSSYYIGQTEVTQALWQAVMESNPSAYKGDNLPVEQVSWSDCQTFIKKLNELTGKQFRLPSEAEWEFAARGGVKSRGYKYSGSDDLEKVAWCYGTDGTYPVGTKVPNELGIYDMSGNVEEWCSDRYGRYNGGSQTNPTGPNSGQTRVFRGGCWAGNYAFETCRSSCRDNCDPGTSDFGIGLRLALSDVQTSSDAMIKSNRGSSSNADSNAKRDAEIQKLLSNMVYVQGGTFTMGATSEQSSEARGIEKPVHQVTLSSYYIGQTEVTQALWQAVMGSNPSYFKGDNRPVECVSWNVCQTFISKLNAITGKHFRLPTEAEWEFAARGGVKSCGLKYSGSNYIDNVAWYSGNSGSPTHDVATKQPNELGIYDMSGNVYEWCSDWYGSYSSSSQTNPTGPNSGQYRVCRGGSWSCLAEGCRSSIRGSFEPDGCDFNFGLRLALSDVTNDHSSSDITIKTNSGSSHNTDSNAKRDPEIQKLLDNMVYVKGGTFTMGATSEQGSDAYYCEKPAHQVTLSNYCIGQTEVTQALWQAVMGSNPSRFKGDNLPVECVSWDDCQAFICKLNAITGKNFRLPTEAEWEFAARGGNNSRGYKYSGSNKIKDVAWYWKISGEAPHPVGTKQPNELGIYDMSGNVWEWCNDWYVSYSSSSQTNPRGPNSGQYRVCRGGSWNDCAEYCRLSNRVFHLPDFNFYYLGFRLALSE